MTKTARANPTGTSRRRAHPAPPPTWIKPQLAKLVNEAPHGPDWLHEIKFDGYRMHARLDAGRVQILTRRGNIWTDKYPATADALPRCRPRTPTSTANSAACCLMAGRRSI